MKTWKRTKRRYAGAIQSLLARQSFERYWSHFSDLARERMAERRGQPSPWSALAPASPPSNMGATITHIFLDSPGTRGKENPV